MEEEINELKEKMSSLKEEYFGKENTLNQFLEGIMTFKVKF